jgi:hypothetical protein
MGINFKQQSAVSEEARANTRILKRNLGYTAQRLEDFL